jgi:predicted RNase H-like HicB family nuclease
MTKKLTAVVTKEGRWFVSRCIEVDVASQGETDEEAMRNLREALELHFEEPVATHTPAVQSFEIAINPA